MSMLRKAKDFRDRIKVAQGKPQHGTVRTGIRARAAARVRGGGGKAGVRLQYTSLRDPGFEAVLDQIDRSDQLPDPLFGAVGSNGPSTSGDTPRAEGGGGERGKLSGRERASGLEEPLFPPSDSEEEDLVARREEGGGGRVDPLLGQTVTDRAGTDSEESEEEEEEVQLVLDAETVNVLESLHLAGREGKPETLSSSGSGYEGVGETEERKSKQEEGQREEEGGKEPHFFSLNESANNNSEVPLKETSPGSRRKEERVGDISDIEINPSLMHHTSKNRYDVSSDPTSASQSSPRHTTDHVTDRNPSIAPIIHHSPPSPSSNNLHSATVHQQDGASHDPVPSPLASSYETEEEFFSLRHQPPPSALCTSPPSSMEEGSLERERERASSVPLCTPVAVSTGLSNDDLETSSLAEGVTSIDDQTVKSTSECSIELTSSLPHSLEHSFTDKELREEETEREQDVGKTARERRKETKEEGLGRKSRELTPAEEHPLTGNAAQRFPGNAAQRFPESDDELFPDDVKNLRDLHEAVKQSKKNDLSQSPLAIKDNHFSSSPEQQRKNRTSQTPQSNSVGTHPMKQNSRGKLPPPRPPLSPQLQRRMLHSTPGKKLHPAQPAPLQGRERMKKMSVTRPPVSTPRHNPPESHAPTDTNLLVAPKHSADGRVISASGFSSIPSTHSIAPPSTTTHPPPSSVLGSCDQSKESAATKTEPPTENTSAELPYFAIHIHLMIAGIVYLYYALNPFVYLSGLLAGFLLFYLGLGTVFILYVQSEEEVSREADSPTALLEDNNKKSMVLRSEEFIARFKTRKFMATLDYDLATHHRKQRMISDIELKNSFFLHIKVWNSDTDMVLNATFDLRKMHNITIVPEDVFTNRKRRWSKKYPIKLQDSCHLVFLFTNTSRKKEEWFRRLREAQDGKTVEDLITKQNQFYRYIERYFPKEPAGGAHAAPIDSSRYGVPPRHQHRRTKASVGTVQFSSAIGTAADDGSINISQSRSRRQASTHSTTSPQNISSSITSSFPSLSQSQRGVSPTEHAVTHPDFTTLSSATIPSTRAHTHPTSSTHYESPSPSASTSPYSHPHTHNETDWINVLAARLCWDVWNEERWKNWVMTRIQKKLVRIKTPAILESLKLTDVALGDKMPVVNRLHEGPFVRADGVWVYLDVTYEGLFVMTIETKLRLGQRQKREKGTEMLSLQHQLSHFSTSPVLRSSGTGEGIKCSHATRAVSMESSVDPEDDSDTASEDESLSRPLDRERETTTTAQPSPPVPTSSPPPLPPALDKKSQRRAKLKSVMNRLTKTVTSTRLVRRAAERVSNVPLELTVEVRKLRGILAVNIAPPPSDTVWYGFKDTPKLELVAKPRLGQKEVTLSRITHWIENKLCALVDEKLKLPNMEDLVVPVLNSGLPEDEQKTLSDSNTSPS